MLERKTLHVIYTDLEGDDQAQLRTYLLDLAKKSEISGNPIGPVAIVAAAHINGIQVIRTKEYMDAVIKDIQQKYATAGKPAPVFPITYFRGESTNKLLFSAGKELSTEGQAEVEAAKIAWARHPNAPEFQPQTAELQNFINRHDDHKLNIILMAEATKSTLSVIPAEDQTAELDLYAGFNLRSPFDQNERDRCGAEMVEGFEAFQGYVDYRHAESELQRTGPATNYRLKILSDSQDPNDQLLCEKLNATLQALQQKVRDLTPTFKEQEKALQAQIDAATAENIGSVAAVYSIGETFAYLSTKAKGILKNAKDAEETAEAERYIKRAQENEDFREVKEGDADADLLRQIKELLKNAETKSEDPKAKIDLLGKVKELLKDCLLYTSPSPRDGLLSRMPSSA